MKIMSLKLLVLPLLFWHGWESSTAGIVYRGVDSRLIHFVESISLGKDRVCTYSGKMRVKPHEVGIFIPEGDLRKKIMRRESVIKRWEVISRVDDMAIYGPLSPQMLYSDLIDETASDKGDKLVAAAAIGAGAYITATGALSMVLKNLYYDAIPQKAGFVAALANAAEWLGLIGPDRKNISTVLRQAKQSPLLKLLEKGFLETMADKNVLRTQLLSLLISNSTTVLTVGFSTIAFGTLMGNLEHQLFTSHKIKSILSNTLVVEADLDSINRLNSTIAGMPENLTETCPNPNDIHHQLSWGDFSYYDFKFGQFPEDKVNFNVIVDMILKKMSPL